MPAVSPRLGEFLIKTTKAKDIDNAFQKVLTEYLELKLKNLDEIIERFQSDPAWLSLGNGGRKYDIIKLISTNTLNKEKKL